MAQNNNLPYPSRRIEPEASFSVTTGEAVNKTIADNEMIELSSEQFSCYVKYKTATDTADATSDNSDYKVLANSKEFRKVPEGCIGISIIASGGTATFTLVRTI